MHVRDMLQHDRETRNVTSIGVQSPLLGLLSYSLQHNADMHSHECAQITAKLCRRRCLGRVAATWDKFDNRLPVGNRFTGLPVTVITSGVLKPTYKLILESLLNWYSAL